MAYSSFGTLLKRGDGGSPESFATIGEVLDIKGPELEADTEDSTNHSSTDGWDESIVTILKGGELTFDINYLPENATHNLATGFLKDFNNRTKRNFQLVFPNPGNTTWNFGAFVTKFSPANPVKGIMKGSVTLKISGKPTLV